VTISTQHSVFCDVSGPNCSGWTGDDVGASIRLARKIAKLHGWKYQRCDGERRYIDVCPACHKYAKEEANA
jgi:hypothetical protein